MVMVPQTVPELKRFLQPLGLKAGARTMVTRLLTAFMLHVGRTRAASRFSPCHDSFARMVCWARRQHLGMPGV